MTLALLLSTLPVVLFAAPPAERVLTDFTEKRLAAKWQTVNDNVMGGRSTGGPRFTGETLVFEGVTNTNGGGFSSIRTRANGWSFADSAGIWIRFRGDGREFQLDLRQTGDRSRRGVSYRAKFETVARRSGWQVVRLPYEAFVPGWRGRRVRGAGPIDPAKITSLGLFIYDGKSGRFRIEVDAIGVVPRKMSVVPGRRASVRVQDTSQKGRTNAR